MTTSPYGTRRRALSDLARFGSLIVHRGSYVADVMHWPELAHEPKTIDDLLKDGLGVKHGDGSVVITAAGRKTLAEYQEAAGVAS